MSKPGRTFWICVIVYAAATAVADDVLDYPAARRSDHTDTYHGVTVPDPYRWLETDVRESDEVAAWIERQNAATQAYLETIAERPAIAARLEELWDFEKYSSPVRKGGRLFFLKNEGLQNQSVLYTAASLDAEPRVLIDPNTWSDDGTVALAGFEISDDGQYVAYGMAEAGSDWQTWHILHTGTREELDDTIQWVKYSGVSWTKDAAGFYYSRYDAPEPGEKYQTVNLNQKVFYHARNTDQAQDRLVYERPDHPEWGFDAEVTHDGKWLVLTVWKGTDDKYRIVIKDLEKADAPFVEVVDDFKNQYSLVGNDGSRIFFVTDLNAPRKRLVCLDVSDPDNARIGEIIPEKDATLTGARLINHQFVTLYLEHAVTQARIHDLSGELIREVEFPALGSAAGFEAAPTDKETYYSFSSFALPPSIYRYDMQTGQSRLVRRADVAFDPDAYQARQIFFTSRDGTRVPMFLVHRKGLSIDGSVPTLLYGYGGFNVPLTPRFSVSRLAWMEMGGLFAMANLRGGGEYGEQWHQAGTKRNKQNVFDDFIAAAQWLTDKGYTSPEKLAIQGASNGGLLVGAVMTQRPDLFGACLPSVGVMDMLRFHHFTAGRFWVDDYGSAEDPDEFLALLAYSPYHNIRPGVHYPATLITTADTDDRVVPAHSFKFAAALQHAQGGPAPILIRIETRAGHGAGKPTTKIIQEIADQWAFLVRNLDMTFEAP